MKEKIPTKPSCGRENERLELGQDGRYYCRKILQDANTVCTKSSDCMSGYCVTNTAQAKTGKCYESNTSDYCLWGTTIEEAQRRPKDSLIPPCVN